MKFSLSNLVDPLGLPVSPEALWEQAESTVKTIGEAVKETAQQTFGLDMNGSIQFNPKENPDVAKTPELMEEDKKRLEAIRTQNFFKNTEAEQGKVAMTNSLREKREHDVVEINTKLHRSNVQFENIFNSDGSLNSYTEAAVQRADSEPTPEQIKKFNRDLQIAQGMGKSPGKFTMGEKELEKGTERAAGGHFTNFAG